MFLVVAYFSVSLGRSYDYAENMEGVGVKKGELNVGTLLLGTIAEVS